MPGSSDLGTCRLNLAVNLKGAKPSKAPRATTHTHKKTERKSESEEALHTKINITVTFYIQRLLFSFHFKSRNAS